MDLRSLTTTALLLLPVTIGGTDHDLRPTPRMDFIVADASPRGQVLGGVRVVLLRRGGFKFLGRTSLVGVVSVKRRLLQEEGAVAVLFCKKGYFCGAFRLDDPEFFDYDERFITLEPLEAQTAAGDAVAGSDSDLFVVDARGQALPDVDVLLAKEGSIERLGTTDHRGSLEISGGRLRRAGEAAVLLCDDWHFCGAIPLDEPRLEEFERRVIVLAVVAVR